MEELVAELDTCFISISLEVSQEPRVDHARYLNNWMQVLNDDTLTVDDRRRLQADLSQQFQQLQKRLITTFEDGNDEV